MNVPLSWLKEYVDFDLSPQELASLLTFSGTEVEGIKTIGGDYSGIVVGEVLSVERHPNADRLTVCQVSDGAGTLVVVCGAPNVAPGMKVPLATLGTVLPSGLKIKKAKVRGVESHGMLCAADELGLSEDHSGLMVLSPGARTGTPFSEIAGPPETVLELEVTPNRPDCLSMIGIARELAALLGKPLRLPDTGFREGSESVEALVSVGVEAPESCRRYTARVVSGVRGGASPAWMQRRLAAAGIRPINVIVDITNYVMLECGQPLHAFDCELLSERRIVVRRARDGEAISTLDGTARAISPEMLLIADAHRPVAVAGVMGGAGSEIRESTNVVLLESAYFRPTDVRLASKRLALSTESSYRFERGVDIENVEWASRRAAALMAGLCGGQVAKGVLDCYPGKAERRSVALRFNRARQLLGMDIGPERIVAILSALGFRMAAQDPNGLRVEVPGFRVDVDQEADLIEELARVHGLDKVPTPAPASRLVPGADDAAMRAMVQCRRHLVGLGLTEILNYSFLSEKLLNLVGYGETARRLVLPNPISTDHTVMRDSLIPQMIETLGRNLARQARQAGLFEIGRVFQRCGDNDFAEAEHLCVGLLGPVGRQGIHSDGIIRDDEMLQWIKGVLEALTSACRIPGVTAAGLAYRDLVLEPIQCGCLAEGRSASVRIGGVRCGVMGLVCDRLRTEWRMTGPVAVMELEMERLVKHCLDIPAAKPVCSYPMVARDVAMVVGDTVGHSEVLRVIRDKAPRELCDVRLFDLYRGEHLGPGRKSMAYSLMYRSMDRTLRDDEVNAMHESIKAELRNSLGAEIRES